MGPNVFFNDRNLIYMGINFKFDFYSNCTYFKMIFKARDAYLESMRTLNIDTGSNPLNRRITNHLGGWFNVGAFLTPRAGMNADQKDEIIRENFEKIQSLMSRRGNFSVFKHKLFISHNLYLTFQL